MPTARTFQLDVDTKRYCNRVNSYRKLNGLGNLLPPDIADIDNFVVGLKDLGVWTQTVCWPLLSQHNVGAGTVVLNLGGNGNFTGIVQNGMLWNRTGLNKAANNQMIYFGGDRILTSALTMFTVVRANLGATDYSPFNNAESGGWDRAWWNGLYNFTSNLLYFGTTRNGVSAAMTQTPITGRTYLFNTVGASWGDAATYSQVNGVGSTQSGLALRNPNPNIQGYPIYTLGGSSLGASGTFRGDYAFSFLNFGVISVSVLTSMHSLIKTTIGKSLSLP